MENASPRAKKPAVWNVPLPGRIMISTPMKPTIVALQRRQRTTSPRMITASTVANSGLVKLSAVKSASSIRARA